MERGKSGRAQCSKNIPYIATLINYACTVGLNSVQFRIPVRIQSCQWNVHGTRRYLLAGLQLAKIMILFISDMSEQRRVQQSLFNSQQNVLVNMVGRDGTLGHPMIVSGRQDVASTSHAHTAPRVQWA